MVGKSVDPYYIIDKWNELRLSGSGGATGSSGVTSRTEMKFAC